LHALAAYQVLHIDAPGAAAADEPDDAFFSWVSTGSSWTWVQRSPGVNVSARHWVIPQPDGRTLVRQELEQRGLIGALVGRLMLKKTKRFLKLEAQGLKNRSEQLHSASGQPS